MRVQSLVWSTGALPAAVERDAADRRGNEARGARREAEAGGERRSDEAGGDHRPSDAGRPAGAVRDALMRLLPRPRRQASVPRSPDTAAIFAPEGAAATAAPDRGAALGSASAVSDAQAATALAIPKTSR